MKTLLRRFALISLVLVVALAILETVNYRRVDAGGLSAGVETLIERSSHLQKLARPEYQDHALAALPANLFNGAYYRLDEHLSDARVVTAPELAPNGDDGVIYRLEFENAEHSGLVAPQGDAAQQTSGGILRLTGDSDSAYVTNEVPITVRRGEIGDIVIRARALGHTRLTLGLSKDQAAGDPFDNSIEMTIEKSEEFRTYVINARTALTRDLGESDPVAHVNLRPSPVAGVAVEIDFIRFVSRQALYLAAVNGTTYETIGNELRPTLYMLSDQHLSYRMIVPQGLPRLTFGQGILISGDPVHFSVTLTEGKKTLTIQEAEVISNEKWQDHEIDLTPWAGKSVTIGLHAKAAHPKSVAFWSSPRVLSKPADRLNIVVILEDALRADYLSTYGFARETSPNKTKLMADRGVLFEHAFSQATKTRPSVPTLMTGLYPTATGVWHFSDMLSDRYLTLAEILRSQGFTTASFIQNGNAGPYAGMHQGFDVLRDEKLMDDSTETVLGEQTIDWLGRHKDENFLLYLHVVDPHGPYDPPPPFDEWYVADKGKGTAVKPDFRRHEPEGMTQATDVERRARYAGEIKHNDSLVPGIFARLEELGLAKNTLVIFLADHGEYLGEHGFWEHHPPSLTPTIHVPLMMIYPKRFTESKRITENVQLIDVMPTILDLAGIGRSDLLLQGDSLVDLIEGRNTNHWQDRVVVAEEPTAMLREAPCPCASLIYRDWHLVASSWMWRGSPALRRLPSSLQATLQMRVFNFHEDSTEETLFPSFLPDLYLRWLQYDAATRLREAGGIIHDRLTADENAATRLDPETLEHLRGLGYVN
jgi:arylsulfatase A-like enzyme